MNRLDCFLEAYSGRGYVPLFSALPSGTVFLHHADRRQFEELTARLTVKAAPAETVWVVHDIFDCTVAGLIFPERGKGVVNLAPHCPEVKIETNGKVLELTQRMLNLDAEAFPLSQQIEARYAECIDGTAFDSLKAKTAAQLIGAACGSEAIRNRELFSGTTAITGHKDYISELAFDVKRRFFIRGRSKNAKSDLLKELAQAANTAGFDAEVYLNNFDPQRYDMVIFPGLDACVADAARLDESTPARAGDEVISFGAPGVERELPDTKAADGLQNAYWACMTRLALLTKAAYFEAQKIPGAAIDQSAILRDFDNNQSI